MTQSNLTQEERQILEYLATHNHSSLLGLCVDVFGLNAGEIKLLLSGQAKNVSGGEKFLDAFNNLLASGLVIQEKKQVGENWTTDSFRIADPAEILRVKNGRTGT